MVKHVLSILVTSLLLTLASARADTYYVRKDGNNAWAGTATNTAWLTVQHALDEIEAGDTANIGPGYYNEDLDTVASGTANTNRIVLLGESGATVKGFTFQEGDDYITISGLTFSNNHVGIHDGEWTYFIEVDKSSDYGVITNCFFDNHNADLTHQYQFTNSNFRKGAIRFSAGSFSEGDTNFFPTDLSKGWHVVSNREVAFFQSEGINKIVGYNMVFEGNILTNFLRGDHIYLYGSNNVVRGNTIIGNPSCYGEIHDWEWANNREPGDHGLIHGDWIQCFGQVGNPPTGYLPYIGSRNHLIERNYYRDHYSQGSQLSAICQQGKESISQWTFRNNIFIGSGCVFGCDYPGSVWVNNLFYNCSTNIGSTNEGTPGAYLDPFQNKWVGEQAGAGALSFTTDYSTFGYGIASNCIVKNNIFLNCGAAGSWTIGWYAHTNAGVGNPGLDGDYNYVGKTVGGTNYSKVRTASTTNYPPAPYYWYEVHGINGGTIGFVNESALNFNLSSGSILKHAGIAIPGLTNDFDGNPRDVDEEVSIGPFQYPTSLKVHFNFEDDFTNHNYIEDMTGNGHHAYRMNYANPWIRAATGPGGQAGEWYQTGYMSNDAPNVYGLSQYAAITNLDEIEFLTNGTVSVLIQWGMATTNNIDGACRGATIFDAGASPYYYASPTGQLANCYLATNTWGLKYGPVSPDDGDAVGATFYRTADDHNMHHVNLVQYRQVRDSNLWHHITVTWDATANTMANYSNGVLLATTNFTYPFLRVGGRGAMPPGGATNMTQWLSIGADMHGGSMSWYDDKYPNDGYLIGKIDDIRIYNKALSGSEVSALYSEITSEEAPGVPDTLTVSPATITSTRMVGSSSFTSNYTVQFTGEGSVLYTNSESAGWLSIGTPTTRTNSGGTDTITVTNNPAGLSAGSYSTNISITWTGATETVTVSLTLTNAPDPPELSINKTSFIIECLTNTLSISTNFVIDNLTGGGSILHWTNTANVSWLTNTPTTGQTASDTDTITVTFNTGLGASTNTGTITVTSTNGVTGSPAAINVTLRLNNGVAEPPPPAGTNYSRATLRGKVTPRGKVIFR